jgi:ribonuclease J
MRARIHRGSHEIGGSCVELEHDGARLVLLGKPLSAGWADEVPLPDVPGLATGEDPRLLGVLLSHGHADHWGLLPQVHPSVPRYCGRATADVLRAASFWGLGVDLGETGHLVDREPLPLGPFTVTPYLVDHSAYDAAALLVEAGRDRLFYTGDIRAHGRKASLFERLLADPPRDVDVLLMEGTNVRPAGDELEKPVASEAEVELSLAETLRGTDGLAVVLSSAQNVDRLVTAYRAAKRVGRMLVVDPYTADVARATGNPNIPAPGPVWPLVRVYVAQRQRVRIKQAGEFHRAAEVKPYRLFSEDLAAAPERYVVYGAFSSEVARFVREGVLTSSSAAIWSLWDGYLVEPSGKRLEARLSSIGLELIHHHTSGHASSVDLKRLVDAIGARRVVPIHTQHGAAMVQVGLGTYAMSDGEQWEVGYGQ